jgi:serine/threonine protein kinase
MKTSIFGFKVLNEFRSNIHAIEFIHPDFPDVTKAVIKTFENSKEANEEINISLRLSSICNVFLKVYQTIRGPERSALIFEYCENGSLFLNTGDRPNRKSFLNWDEQKLLFHFMYLVKALKLAHQSKIAHRDVSCCNFFVAGDSIKIGDFGGAKITDRGDEQNTRQGTDNYMSPKQITSLKFPKYPSNYFLNDVWGLGVLFFEMALNKFNQHKFGSREKSLTQVEIDDVIKRELSNYSQDFRNLLSLMLKSEESERITMKKAYKAIRKIYYTRYN